MKIIFATHNEDKLREVREQLQGFPLEVFGLKDIEFYDEIIEDGETFYDNAKIKAEVVFKRTGLPTLADDSGLCVDALNGGPGVYSARFGGGIGPKEKNQLLLNQLKEVPDSRRGAYYVCCLYFIKDEVEDFSVEGICKGRITQEPVGVDGFGFDPIFYLEDYQCTMAEIPLSEKNKISHRGKAIEDFKERLLSILPGGLTK